MKTQSRKVPTSWKNTTVHCQLQLGLRENLNSQKQTVACYSNSLKSRSLFVKIFDHDVSTCLIIYYIIKKSELVTKKQTKSAEITLDFICQLRSIKKQD